MRKRFEKLLLSIKQNRIESLVILVAFIIMLALSILGTFRLYDNKKDDINYLTLSEFMRWEMQTYFKDNAVTAENIICTSKSADELLERYLELRTNNYSITSGWVEVNEETDIVKLFTSKYNKFLQNKTDLNPRIHRSILNSLYSDIEQSIICDYYTYKDISENLFELYTSINEDIGFEYKSIPNWSTRITMIQILNLILIISIIFIASYIYTLSLIMKIIKHILVKTKRDYLRRERELRVKEENNND